jgi:hypothetical protein
MITLRRLFLLIMMDPIPSHYLDWVVPSTNLILASQLLDHSDFRFHGSVQAASLSMMRILLKRLASVRLVQGKQSLGQY